MPRRAELLALPLLLMIVALALPAGAMKWARITAASDKRERALFVLPSGVGYAANREQSYMYFGHNSYTNISRTRDGGKSWKAITQPAGEDTSAEAIGMWLVGKDGSPFVQVYAIRVAFMIDYHTVYSATSDEWTGHDIDIPVHHIKGQWTTVWDIARVPGHNQAFAIGNAYTHGDMTDPASYPVDCIWRWAGGTQWTVTKMPGVRRVVAAYPSAAWATFENSGNISRWSGSRWVKQYTGVAGEAIEALAAVSMTSKTPPMMWARRTVTKNGRSTQTLLLCNSTACATKKAAGTTRKYPGAFGELQASGPNFALVWELIPTDNEASREVRLQQFNGSAWKTVLTVTVARQMVPLAGWGRQAYFSSELLLSVASPTRAAVVVTYQHPVSSKTMVLDTRTWDGTKWTKHTSATVPKAQLDYDVADRGHVESVQLQALASGGALLALRQSLWRLV